MNQILLEKYAEFAVKSGCNVQKGQTLIINSPIEADFFARLCAKAAYEAGAYDVVVHYSDEKLSRIRMENAEISALEDVKPWKLRSYLDYTDAKGGAAVLSILARDPEVFKGLDTAKVAKASMAASKAMIPWKELIMQNRVQWSIVSIPTEAWATKVFAGEEAHSAIEKLWEQIFTICRVQDGDPVIAWEKHVATLKNYQQWLQELELVSIHLTASNGTDLEIGLPEGHVWAGGGDVSAEGVTFLPNIPTEEIFTAPHRLRVNGQVRTTLPYVYNGNLIEDIWVRFENGKVVEYSASKGEDLLKEMMGADEGARHIGEIALVPATSPIRQSGLLFYNTLFDENAACHIAFGAAYPESLEGGSALSKEEQLQAGLNDSLIHEDVMIGTDDMCITGTCKNGDKVSIFEQGNWTK